MISALRSLTSTAAVHSLAPPPVEVIDALLLCLISAISLVADAAAAPTCPTANYDSNRPARMGNLMGLASAPSLRPSTVANWLTIATVHRSIHFADLRELNPAYESRIPPNVSQEPLTDWVSSASTSFTSPSLSLRVGVSPLPAPTSEGLAFIIDLASQLARPLSTVPLPESDAAPGPGTDWQLPGRLKCGIRFALPDQRNFHACLYTLCCVHAC